MQTSIDRIWNDLEWLASCPRFAETERLEECRSYCERSLSESGWQVNRVHFQSRGKDRLWQGVNLVCPPQTADKPVLIIGAHLDSREETPGADDNASAVAVLLECARLFSSWPADAAVGLELVVFDLEELGMLGGEHHAVLCRQNDRDVAGMVSLEMLGYCSHEPGSQQFPPEIADRYPSVGNFIGIVGNQNSGAMIDSFVTAFGTVPALRTESLQVPENGHLFPPTRLSDHSPFWDHGYPALMVTDTSWMRNPHYHEPSDTPETLDREFLHKVAEGVVAAIDAAARTRNAFR
tara:strand:+ start:755 stop:1633 length:879 start_codon:yes stop_codon:yes gene_type:complete